MYRMSVLAILAARHRRALTRPSTVAPVPPADACIDLLRSLEKNANQLQKEAKAYLDAVRSVSASSTRIGQTLDLFFGSDSGEQAMAANAYKRAVEELEGSTAMTIVSAYGRG